LRAEREREREIFWEVLSPVSTLALRVTACWADSVDPQVKGEKTNKNKRGKKERKKK